MNEDSIPDVDRIRTRFSRVMFTLGAVARVAFGCSAATVFLLVAAAALWGDFKSTFGWIASLFESDASAHAQSVVVRPIDPARTLDNRLVQAIAAVADAASYDALRLRAVVVEDGTINAMNLGNDQFVFFAGLEQISDADLMFVVAHEIAHEQLKHVQINSQIDSTASSVANAIGHVLGATEEGRQEARSWMSALALPHFSKTQEIEADKHAVDILARGMGVRGPAIAVAVRALDNLRVMCGESGGGMLDLHPSISERIAILRSELGN